MSEIVSAARNPLPSDQTEDKRDKGVMVYLTDTERTAFKKWAFEQGVSMSEVLATEVCRLLGSTQYDTHLLDIAPQAVDEQHTFALEASYNKTHSEACADDGTVSSRAVENHDALVALSSQRHQIDTELEARIWAALTDGDLLPDLAALTGLPQEHIRQILNRNPHCG